MRQPITLKIKFKSASIDQFIERYSVDVSRGGIFIRTKDLKEFKVGTQLRFEFQLQDSSALISGEGTVVWTREHDAARAGVAPGMGVRFDKLASSSNQVLDQILAEKARRGEAQVESRFDAGARASASASGVLNNPPRKPSDFEQVDSKAGTPLPKPAPGLDGAEEEFGQESTRVMQDDVVQRLAEKTRDKPAPEMFADEITRARGPDELAHLLRQSGPTEPSDSNDKTSVDEHALPAIPPRASSPPVISSVAPPPPAAKAEAKMDAKPESKFVEPVTRADTPVLAPPIPRPSPPPPNASVPELPAVPTPPPVAEKAPPAAAALELGQHAMANERPHTRKKSSPMPVIVGIVLVAGAAGVFLMMQGNGNKVTPTTTSTVAQTDTAKTDRPAGEKPSEPAVAANDPAPTAAPGGDTKGAPVTPEPKVAPTQGPTVAVASEPAGATVTVDGKAQEGVTPTTLSGLEPKKSYEVVVALKGYRDWKGKVQVKDGAKVEAKLVPNEKVVEVSSTPAGADLFVDGKKVGRTPYTLRKFDVASEHKIEVRRGGFIAQTRSVAAGDSWEQKGEGRDVLAVAMTLEAEPPKAKPVVSGRHPVVAGGKKPDGTVPDRVTPEPVGDKPAVDKPIDKPTEPADNPVDKPADKADKPVDKPAEKSDKPVDKPAEKSDKPKADKPDEEKVKLPPPPKEKAGEGAQPE